MASSSSAKHFSLLFFFIPLLFSASSQVEARESKLFFSKVTRLIGTINKVITEVPTPAPAPGPAPETFESIPIPAPTPTTSFDTKTENGYGLYGSTDQETPAEDVENGMLTEEPGGEAGFHNGYDKSNYNVENENYNVESGKGNYYYGNNNGYGSEKSRSEQQGMSDTRFLENGKYYHDVKNDQNENRYKYNGYDDQTAERGARYVFDSMEEYEKYQESQGMYVP